jgi:hypothetical protein
MSNRSGRSVSVSRAALFAGLALTALLVGFVASPATAAPKGEYAVFADCPTSNPALAGCIVSRTESGEVKIGTQTVPIKNTQTLQGGFTENEETFTQAWVAAADGNTLSKTPQPVPGGLAGLISCPEISNILVRIQCEITFENGLTAVNATTELAAPASSIGLNENNLFTELGATLTLPVKVKLENPFLGNNCYIGSNSSPMTLSLTDGTTSPPEPNKPITGKKGTFTTRAEDRILVISENTLVDNAFSAPVATGCGGLASLLVDPIVNAKLGLPSASGHNTAILNNTIEQTGIEAAREHE